MLTHESAPHRLSALWVVQQLGLFTLVSRIRRMAAGDPDPQVRERAEQILNHPDFAAETMMTENVSESES